MDGVKHANIELRICENEKTFILYNTSDRFQYLNTRILSQRDQFAKSLPYILVNLSFTKNMPFV